MTYTDIEKQYGFKFPKKFHQIRETGAMEWMECDKDTFFSRRDEFINDPKAFMMIDADCEPITVNDFEKYMHEIAESIEAAEEYANLTLDPKYRLVPFAFMGSGDVYCFVYEGNSEPFVVLLYHDEAAGYEYYGKDFDEFLYLMMLDSAASSLYFDEEYKTAAWIKHLDYLSDDYRVPLENSEFETPEAAEKKLLEIVDSKKVEIWVKK